MSDSTITSEGEELRVKMFAMRDFADREADLELGLYISTLTKSSVLADIQEPTGTGYARMNLIDANWTGAGNQRVYAEQVFTAGTGGWTGQIIGWFLATKSAGGTARLYSFRIIPGGPYDMPQGAVLRVTPTLQDSQAPLS